MLRLLAQREQGYEDIAALMGLSVEQVRAKVNEALAEIDSTKAAAPPSPTPPAPAEEPTTPPKAEAPAVAPKPPAPAPTSTSTGAPAPAAAASAAPKAQKRARPSLPSDRRHLIEWAGGGVVVLLIVLFITGAIDIGGSGSDTKSGASHSGAAESEALAANVSKKVTQATLSPVDGGDAKGLAVFGRLKKKIIMQVEAVGLDPSPPGSSYTVWLYKSPDLALRVGATPVSDSGGLAVRIQIPEEAFAAVAARVFDQISISLTSDAQYKAEVAKARSENRLPAYTGTDILRGPITGPEIKAGNSGG
jgi:hypothetical protein